MKSSSWLPLMGLLIAGATLGVTGLARAETKIASLGVRSLDGEDELERKLSTTLRASAGALGGYAVSDRELSLEQMSLAYGCDEPDAKCLHEIARSLSVERLVYGTVIVKDDGHELTVLMYALGAARIESASAGHLTVEHLTGAPGKETITSLLRRAFGLESAPAEPLAGTLLLLGGTPGAAVVIDGNARGTLNENGWLRLSLAPGKHSVRLGGQGAAPADEKVAQVAPNQETELSLATPKAAQFIDTEKPYDEGLPEPSEQPAEPPTRSLRRALGWASVGVGAAFAIATIYSWVRIEKINDDSDYLAYRGAFPRANLEGGVKDVCGSAKRGALAAREPGMPALADLEQRALDLCDTAQTLEALQYVFIAGTVVGAGVGTYLLLTSRKPPRGQAVSGPRRWAAQPVPTTLHVAPRFGLQSASLAATVSF